MFNVFIYLAFERVGHLIFPFSIFLMLIKDILPQIQFVFGDVLFFLENVAKATRLISNSIQK
jgi:hypothetical protein